MTPCDACREKRLHTPAEWNEFHRFAGHGFTEGMGWTHPALEKAANERANERTSAASPAHSAQTLNRHE